MFQLPPAGKRLPLAILLTALALSLAHPPASDQVSGPPEQPASLIYDEMRTVYLGNLARRDNGVPLSWPNNTSVLH